MARRPPYAQPRSGGEKQAGHQELEIPTPRCFPPHIPPADSADRRALIAPGRAASRRRCRSGSRPAVHDRERGLFLPIPSRACSATSWRPRRWKQGIRSGRSENSERSGGARRTTPSSSLGTRSSGRRKRPDSSSPARPSERPTRASPTSGPGGREPRTGPGSDRRQKKSPAGGGPPSPGSGDATPAANRTPQPRRPARATAPSRRRLTSSVPDKAYKLTRCASSGKPSSRRMLAKTTRSAGAGRRRVEEAAGGSMVAALTPKQDSSSGPGCRQLLTLQAYKKR